MYVAQFPLARAVVTLIAAACSAVSQKVLGCRDHVRGIQEMASPGIALQALDHRGCVLAHDLRIFGVALVGSTPAGVADDGQRGPEGPVESGDADFDGGDLADPPDQGRIMSGA